jgi:thiol-disulfide isomerase/thioredoxin
MWSSSPSFHRQATVLCASAALSLAAGCIGDKGASDASSSSGGLIGSAAPPITAEPVGGQGPTNLKDASGKVVIVDFWATYCAPCKKSFPKYQEMVDQFSGELAFIAVSVDDPEDATQEQLQEFAKETGVKFAIVWDKDKSTTRRYNPSRMPTSFVIDKAGVVRHVHAGYESGEEGGIVEEIEALLGE